MSEKPINLVLARLRELGKTIRATGADSWQAQCPAHGDVGPSLTINVGTNPQGRVLLHCKSGCDFQAVVTALGMSASDMVPHDDRRAEPRGPAPRIPLTVAALATAKKLPEDYLRTLGLEDAGDRVLIRYFRADGSSAPRHRIRSAISAGKGSYWSEPKGGTIYAYGLHRLQAARDAGELILVEGESDCWTLWHHGFHALGIPGASLVKTLTPECLEGIPRIYIHQEPGPAAARFRMRLLQTLAGYQYAGQIYTIRLKDHKDPSELHKSLHAEGTFVFAWRSAMDSAERARLPDPLPEILCNGRQMSEVIEDSIDALLAANDPPVLFRRGGVVVRIQTDEEGRHSIHPIDDLTTRSHMVQAAHWYRITDKGQPPTYPPIDIARDILRRHELPPFPPLEGCSETPLIRPDGQIVTRPGYDPSTRYVYAPGVNVPTLTVPDKPTKEHLRAARDVIEDVIADFPFDGTASLANEYALLLTIIMRPVIPGAIPLLLIDSPRQGTGKDMLARVMYAIATGREPPMMTAPDPKHGAEEMKKRITTTLLGGDRLKIITNIEHRLGGEALSSVLTARQYEDRIMGTHQRVLLTPQTIWVATGNNLAVDDDLIRRCWKIRIDAGVAMPWMRTGWRHPRLIDWAITHRAELLSAAFTMIRAWYVAGRPAPTAVKPIGDYEDWCHTIGGILETAGIPSFLQNQDDMLRECDQEAVDAEALLEAIFEFSSGSPFTTNSVSDKLLDEMKCSGGSGRIPGWLQSASDRGSGTFVRALGNWLRRKRGTIYGNYRLLQAGQEPSRKVSLWRVVQNVPRDCG